MKPEPIIELLTGEISLAITRSIVLLGRHPECDLQLNHPCISRRHCCIVLADKDLYVRDLDSRHGVWVNGERVSERKLAHHDQIAVGMSFFRVLFPAESGRADDRRDSSAKPLTAVNPSLITDFETIPPLPVEENKQEEEESAVKPEMSEVLNQHEVKPVSGDLLISDEARSDNNFPDVLDDLEGLGPEGNDSGYEPVFDLKL